MAAMDDTGKDLEDGLHVLVTFASENEVVFQYRLQELLAAGFGEAEATWIAQDTTIDLHHAVDLVKKHRCDPGLAARILL